VFLVAHLPQREAVSPEVSAPSILGVEPLGVAPVHPVQRAREEVARALDDEVVVVRHQAEGVDVQPESVDGSPDLCEELSAVVAVEIDLSPLDAPRRRMPDAVLRECRSSEASHLDHGRACDRRNRLCGAIGTELLRSEGRVRGQSPDASRAGVSGSAAVSLDDALEQAAT